MADSAIDQVLASLYKIEAALGVINNPEPGTVDSRLDIVTERMLSLEPRVEMDLQIADDGSFTLSKPPKLMGESYFVNGTINVIVPSDDDSSYEVEVLRGEVVVSGTKCTIPNGESRAGQFVDVTYFPDTDMNFGIAIVGGRLIAKPFDTPQSPTYINDNVVAISYKLFGTHSGGVRLEQVSYDATYPQIVNIVDDLDASLSTKLMVTNGLLERM